MARGFIYTGAADSEGTLGGLVSLGGPATLGRLLDQTLEQVRLCASHPLCGEHHPHCDGLSQHGAACHVCLFTSCEHGNKYLDRATLLPTFQNVRIPFFVPYPRMHAQADLLQVIVPFAAKGGARALRGVHVSEYGDVVAGGIVRVAGGV